MVQNSTQKEHDQIPIFIIVLRGVAYIIKHASYSVFYEISVEKSFNIECVLLGTFLSIATSFMGVCCKILLEDYVSWRKKQKQIQKIGEIRAGYSSDEQQSFFDWLKACWEAFKLFLWKNRILIFKILFILIVTFLAIYIFNALVVPIISKKIAASSFFLSKGYVGSAVGGSIYVCTNSSSSSGGDGGRGNDQPQRPKFQLKSSKEALKELDELVQQRIREICLEHARQAAEDNIVDQPGTFRLKPIPQILRRSIPTPDFPIGTITRLPDGESMTDQIVRISRPLPTVQRRRPEDPLKKEDPEEPEKIIKYFKDDESSNSMSFKDRINSPSHIIKSVKIKFRGPSFQQKKDQLATPEKVLPHIHSHKINFNRGKNLLQLRWPFSSLRWTKFTIHQMFPKSKTEIEVPAEIKKQAVEKPKTWAPPLIRSRTPSPLWVGSTSASKKSSR